MKRSTKKEIASYRIIEMHCNISKQDGGVGTYSWLFVNLKKSIQFQFPNHTSHKSQTNSQIRFHIHHSFKYMNSRNRCAPTCSLERCFRREPVIVRWVNCKFHQQEIRVSKLSEKKEQCLLRTHHNIIAILFQSGNPNSPTHKATVGVICARSWSWNNRDDEHQTPTFIKLHKFLLAY